VCEHATNSLVRQFAPFLYDERGELIAAGNEDMDTHVPWQKISKSLGAFASSLCSRK
jgi:hypothetical protein